MEEKIQELESTIESLQNELAESFYKTIQVLAQIVLAQENYYEGSHSRYVSQKSAEVARKLGMNEHEVFEISIAGLLHDIGKVGFKDTLLAKFTSEMKESEYKQYQLHPELGRQILSKHDGFDSICEMIAQHHEKIDGSGFPLHLMGKEINPGSAIIAVVDSYHTLYYKRKKERSTVNSTAINVASTATLMDNTKSRFAMAMNYLHQKAGKIFDSKVVDVFTDIIDSERQNQGEKMILRLPLGKIEPGMIIAEDYFSSYGMLIAASGEMITEEMKKSLIRLAESGELPLKLLVLK